MMCLNGNWKKIKYILFPLLQLSLSSVGNAIGQTHLESRMHTDAAMHFM